MHIQFESEICRGAKEPQNRRPLYRNYLKNREFDKEAPQNFHLERATIVQAQGASEDENFEEKPTPSKLDFSSSFGISFATTSFVYFFCFFLYLSTGIFAQSKDLLAAGRDSYWKVENTAVMHPLIILDAGHGGADEGTKVSALKEKRLTLLTVLLTKKHLEELGYRVMLTRGRDIYLTLPKRVSIANRTKATLFVSVHYNSAPSPEANGIEIFYFDSKEIWRSRASKRLAQCVLHRILDQTEAASRGVKTSNFHVIRETDMPAVLVEAGFITNYKERQKLKDREYIDRIAIGIAQGIDKYMKT